LDENKQNAVLAHFRPKEEIDEVNARMNEVIEAREALHHKYESLLSDYTKVAEKKGRMDSERAQIYRDAASMYKRGMVELQLNLFLKEHNYITSSEFRCDGCMYPKTMTSLMRHWRTCSKHKSKPTILTHKQDGMIRLDADRAAVEDALDKLYSTLSSNIHAKFGEQYPVVVCPLPQACDTLALLSFFEHCDIAYKFGDTNADIPVIAD
jgi:hypothetical protein